MEGTKPTTAQASQKAANVAGHMQNLLTEVEQLETSLQEQKDKNQRIARDYVKTREILETKVSALEAEVADQKIAFEQLNLTSEKDLNVLQNELKKTRGELARFQESWNEVLKREQDARQVLSGYQKAQAELKTLKDQMDESKKERDYFHRQALELQMNVKHLNQQLEISKKELALATQRAEQNESSLKTRLQNELDQYKAQLQVKAKDIVNQSRAKFRMESQEKLSEEIHNLREKSAAADRRTQTEFALSLERSTQLKEEVEQLTHTVRTQEGHFKKMLLDQKESFIAQIHEAHARADALEEENARIKAEGAIQNLTTSQKMREMEEEKMKLHSSLLIKRLELEQEAEKLRAERENLAHPEAKIAALSTDHGKTDAEVTIVRAKKVAFSTLPA